MARYRAIGPDYTSPWRASTADAIEEVVEKFGLTEEEHQAFWDELCVTSQGRDFYIEFEINLNPRKGRQP